MKCISCGREIPAGNVYCPICGKEAQIISDKSVLEEDLLKILLEDDSAVPSDYDVDAAKEAKREKERQLQKKKKLEAQKRKQKKVIMIVLIIILVAAAVLVSFVIKKNNTYEAIFSKAEVAYHTAKYDDAIELTVKAIDKNPESLEAYLLLGDIYVQMDDSEHAHNSYIKVLELDEANLEAYEKLLRMFSAANDYESIEVLASTMPEDAEISKLFNQYLVGEPVVNIPGGKYTEPLKLEFSFKKGTSVYYTLDGTAPSDSSAQYETFIELKEEGSITLQAVCVDENGNASDVLREEYILEFTVPDQPYLDPDGGEFTKETKVTITAQNGTTIYYTWDGSTPDMNSKVYSKPIKIPEGNNILSVIAVDDETKKSSEVLKTNFIYYPVVEDAVSEEQ